MIIGLMIGRVGKSLIIKNQKDFIVSLLKLTKKI